MPNILNVRFPHPLISYYLQVVSGQLGSLEKRVVLYWNTPKNGNIVALMSHILYLLARANLKSSKEPQNDIFAVKPAKSKLFNHTVITLSAQQVKINSLPLSSWRPSNVLNLFKKLSTETRTDQGSLHGTCEIAVWDPILLCLRIFCLFSPGHVLIYWLFYPRNAPDTQPGLDMMKVIFLQILISVQLCLLETHYTQRAKDLSIISRNVMNEYNVKFVYPRLNPIVRDSGTQCAYIIAKNDPILNDGSFTSTSSLIYQKNATISQYLDYDNISTFTYQSKAASKSSPSYLGAVSPYSIQSPSEDQIVEQNITNGFDNSSTHILSPFLNYDHTINPTDSYEEDRKKFLFRREYERGPSFF
ncbi:hypothetical protein EPUL_002838, partial [Erysiphe pulchra]